MADKPKEEKPVVEIKEDKPQELGKATERQYDYEKDHDKPMEELAREEALERKSFREEAEQLKKDLEEEPVEEVVKPEVKEEKKEEKIEVKETKAEIDPAKIAQETAQKALEDYKAELKKVEESKLSEVKKEEKKEELKSQWSKENRTPRDYDEILEEARRLAREDFNAEYEAREAAKAKLLEEQTAAQKAEQARVAETNKANEEYINRRIVEEKERMYQNKVIERPADINDLTDPVVQREQAIFQKAYEVNVERIKNNQEPITSLADIYYNYYLPDEKSKQPAGADAPVSGGATIQNREAPTDEYDYGRDHGKSMFDLARELLGKK